MKVKKEKKLQSFFSIIGLGENHQWKKKEN